MKKTETVTAENFGKYEKKVWRMECRRAKARAGGVAGRIAGDIVFVLALLGTISCVEGPESVALSPLRTLGALLEKMCIAFLKVGGSTFQPILEDTGSGYFFVACLIILVLAALAANLLVNLMVQIIWPGVKFIPVEGNSLEQAEELYQRSEEASELIPSRKWYFNLVPAIAFGIVFTVERMKESTYESGLSPIAEKGLTVVVCGLFALMFMILYLPYRGLSGIIAFKLDRLGRGYRLSSALYRYVKECEKEAKEEEEREQERKLEEEKRQKEEKEKQDRLLGDEIYRNATAGGKVDEELIAEAAELGCRPACLYMARQLMEAWGTGTYTREEKKELMQAAKDYFYIASQEENFPESQAEGAFGYKLFTVLLMEAYGSLERVSVDEWEDMLSELKSIRASGKLPEKYNDACVQLIDSVEDMRNEARERKAHENTIYVDSGFYDRVAARVARSGYGMGGYSSPYPTMGSEAWHKMHDDLDAVQRAGR